MLLKNKTAYPILYS